MSSSLTSYSTILDMEKTGQVGGLILLDMPTPMVLRQTEQGVSGGTGIGLLML